MNFNTGLSVAAQIAPIASALTAAIAAIFISRQIANIRRNREVDTLFKIIALADGDKMRDAMNWLTFDLHQTLTLQELVTDKEVFSKFSRIIHLFETMGVIVNNGYVKEGLIFDKYGLLIIGAWGKLRDQIVAFRTEWQSAEYAENFELLVAKYDKWARSVALKAAMGERIELQDGRYLLDHERKLHHQNHSA